MDNSGNHETITLYPRSAEQFWEQYHEECGFTFNQLTNLWEAAESRYSSLPYHNFRHATDVLWAAMELGKKFETPYKPLNYKVLIGAALFHDVGYHEELPPDQISKEGYSANIFDTLAFDNGLGFTEKEIDDVKDAIISTHQDVQATSRVSKLLNRADLASVGASYEVYERATNVLEQESRLLNENFDELSFAIGSIKVVAKYLMKDLELSSGDHDWYDQAIRNLNKRIRVESNQQGINPREFVISIGSLAVNQIFDQNLSA